jgi:hypothetical protein
MPSVIGFALLLPNRKRSKQKKRESGRKKKNTKREKKNEHLSQGSDC